MNRQIASSQSADHAVCSGMNCWACVWAAFAGAALTAVYQVIRHEMLPRLPDHPGHMITMAFVAIMSAAGCRIVVGLSRRMQNRLGREVAARKETEQFFRVIAVATNAGIWSWDIESDFTWFNPEFVERFGYDLEDALAHDFWRRHVHPDDRDPITASLFAALDRQDLTWNGEYRFQRADGTYAHVLDRGLIFRDEQGRAVRVCGGMLDLTELKKAQAEQARALNALQTSEAAFRSLFENAPFGMYRSRPDGTLLAANSALARMLGYDSVAELLRRNVGTDVYANPCERSAIVDRLEHERSLTGLEVAWKKKDGRTVLVRFSARHCLNGGEPFYECTAEDITQHRELQQELQQSQKMEAIGQLAGGVAHDFNNMLLVIRMGAELLQSGFAADDRRRKRIDEILKTCDRAAALTQQLLAFGCRQIRAPQLLNLNAAVADAMSMIHRLIGESIELTFQAARVPCTATADPAQVVQVLMNLCINARDAMPNGGALDVVTEVVDFAADSAPAGLPPGRYAALTVKDSGSGISEDVVAHLFEPFYTTKQKGKHSGLGLATIYGIVKQSNGAVVVESKPDHGSTFRVFLPYVPAESAQTLCDATADCSPPAGSETILLVEDEPSIRSAVGELLTCNGYRVVTAENGERAMTAVAGMEDELDLLLTDVVMPKMGGRELAQRLSARMPQLKVIFMSGYSDDPEFRQSVRAGAAFMQKPFQFNALLKKVREMLAVPTSATVEDTHVLNADTPRQHLQSLR